MNFNLGRQFATRDFVDFCERVDLGKNDDTIVTGFDLF